MKQTCDEKNPYDTSLNLMRQNLERLGQGGVWGSLRALADRIESLEDPHFGEDESQPRSPMTMDPKTKDSTFNRRELVQWLSGVTALLSGTACTRQPPEAIVPYARMPEHVIPGEPLFFATAFPFEGYGIGILAETHMGRPTKIEGNKFHPASLGATDPFSQASVLTLYDPDRSQTIERNGIISSWQQFYLDLRESISRSRGDGSIRILTPTITSPTLKYFLQQMLGQGPQYRWHQYSPVNFDRMKEGSRLAFGRPLNVIYDLSQADVILSLDADIFSFFPGKLRYARQFARRRTPSPQDPSMNRLYAVTSTPSLTSAVADHRLLSQPGDVEALTHVIAQTLGIATGFAVEIEPRKKEWLAAVIKDLSANAGRCLVVVDETQPAPVHALVHAINDVLANLNRTIFVTEPVEAVHELQSESLAALVEDMQDGRVETLLMVSTNPVYNAPADLNFANALAKVPFKAQLSLFKNETTPYCTWHVPESHFLESWGDIRAFDGTATVMQPAINPLFRSRSAIEFVATVLGKSETPGFDTIRDYWRSVAQIEDFESAFQEWLQNGVIPGTALPTLAIRPNIRFPLASTRRTTKRGTAELVANLRPDPSVWDGELANNAWLQELPKPFTAITWDNTALLHPATAAKYELQNEDVVQLEFSGHRIKAPVWIVPGQAPDTITLTLGYGRNAFGRIAGRRGYDAYLLRFLNSPWLLDGVKLIKTGDRYPLACAQEHHRMYGRDIVKWTTLDHFKKDPWDVIRPEFQEPRFQPTIPVDPEQFPPEHPTPYQWGMAININTCIGCNACVVACQAENNVPVVGKESVSMGRRMHWLRVDNYYSGDIENPDTYFQPVPCMHCETAPCEVVCPVYATAHSQQGLNQMIYNRCVGTRYCSNNCPYKVRRFNFLEYTDPTPILQMVYNPDVTVRSRGVMEKCTYCIQRIQAARIESDRKGRVLLPESVQTACQEACPTQAIVFGNIADRRWDVTQMKANPLNYALLGQLNTKPRTTYLAKVKNLNDELTKPDSSKESSDHG